MTEELQSPDANEPKLKKWQAAPHHWDALEQAGSERGWKLAALSFGYAPIAGVINLLEDDKQKGELSNRRSLINRHRKFPNKDLELQRALVEVNESGIECYYETAGFVRWIESLAEVETYPNTVDPRMTQIAKRWADQPVRREELEAESPAPRKQQVGGKTKVESSLLFTLLGMAMRYYDYIPLGLAASKRPGDMDDVYDRISNHLKDYNLSVSEGVIETRLLEAVGKLSEDDLAKLEEKLAKPKPYSR